jgi:hypothetical protein
VKSVLLFAVVTFAGIDAHAAGSVEDRGGTAAARGAARFSFVAARQLSRTEVVRRAGEPDIAYDTFVEEGIHDPDIAPPVPGAIALAAERARSRGKELVEVEVFEYELDEGLYAVIVLREAAVLYAVIPAAPSQSTQERAAGLYGAGQASRIERAHRSGLELVSWPALGIAFAFDEELPERTRKIVWFP